MQYKTIFESYKKGKKISLPINKAFTGSKCSEVLENKIKKIIINRHKNKSL